jgi:peptide/nickel transport system substrate-binding protein
MRHHPLRVTTLVALAGLLVASTFSTTVLAADPVHGGTLVIARNDPPPCLDSQQSTSHSTLIIGRSIADQLTDQDPESGEIVPWLATAWEVNDDATAYTFTLREDATFSDGTPVDAAAVAANFEGIKALGAKAALGASYIANYASTEVLSPSKFTVHFSQSNRQFLQATTTMTLGIYAPSLYAVAPPDRCLGKGLVASGPFVLTSFVPDQEIVIERRAGYNWPSKLRSHTGEAYLDRVEFPLVRESSVRIGGLLSGEFDVTNVDPQDEPAVDGAGLQFALRPNPGVVNSLFPNEKRPIVEEKAVRQAIQKALNVEEIVATVYTDR